MFRIMKPNLDCVAIEIGKTLFSCVDSTHSAQRIGAVEAFSNLGAKCSERGTLEELVQLTREKMRDGRKLGTDQRSCIVQSQCSSHLVVLPVWCCLFVTACLLLPVWCCLFVTSCLVLLPVCYFLSGAASCLLLSVWGCLFVAACLLLPVWCCLFVAACLLLPVWCCLFVTSCLVLLPVCYFLSGAACVTSCLVLLVCYFLSGAACDYLFVTSCLGLLICYFLSGAASCLVLPVWGCLFVISCLGLLVCYFLSGTFLSCELPTPNLPSHPIHFLFLYKAISL